MMKKPRKILKYVMLFLLALGSFALMTHYYYTLGDNEFGRVLERGCYGVCCLTFAACLYDMVGRFKHLWTKIIAALTTSLLLTPIVFLANNFWRYLNINGDFNWEYPIPLSTVMKWDISYTYGWGEFRYPMAFIIIFVICGLSILLSHPKIKAIYHGWKDKLYNWLFIC